MFWKVFWLIPRGRYYVNLVLLAIIAPIILGLSGSIFTLVQVDKARIIFFYWLEFFLKVFFCVDLAPLRSESLPSIRGVIVLLKYFTYYGYLTQIKVPEVFTGCNQTHRQEATWVAYPKSCKCWLKYPKKTSVLIFSLADHS